jgi:hypothetical protein
MDITDPLALHSFFTSVIMNLWKPARPDADGNAGKRRTPLFVRFFWWIPLLSWIMDMIENWSIYTLLTACGDAPSSTACQALQLEARIGSVASVVKWALLVPIIVSTVWGIVRLVNRRRASAERQHSS